MPPPNNFPSYAPPNVPFVPPFAPTNNTVPYYPPQNMNSSSGPTYGSNIYVPPNQQGYSTTVVKEVIVSPGHHHGHHHHHGHGNKEIIIT